MDTHISWNVSISMSSEAFQSVNVPLSLVSILMDIFFVFCMIFPQEGQQRMKQPLNVLVGSLVGCNTALHFCTLLFVVSDFIYSSDVNSVIFYDVAAEVLLFTMRASITSSLWLNVFYYCQIVPVQHNFFIWLKRNLMFFIYSALVLDKLFFLFSLIVYVVYYIELDVHIPYIDTALIHAVKTDFWLRLVYFLLSLCMMLTSSCATIFYLWRHMKSMEESSRYSPQLQSQMRVTITGIIQTVLYFLCSVWLILDDIVYELTTSQFDMECYILCTVISFYSFGTNINLAVGQSIFREQTVFTWQKLCKTVHALKL